MRLRLALLFSTFSALLPLESLILETAEYCRERKAFGRSILDNQVVHFRLVELETEVELLRSILYRAVGKDDYYVPYWALHARGFVSIVVSDLETDITPL